MRWVEASFLLYKEDMLREATLLFGNPDPLISGPVAFPANNILENIFKNKIWNKSAGLYHNPPLHPHATFSGLEQKCLLLYLWFPAQHFAITGCNYKLSENFHWIINRVLWNVGNFSWFPKNYHFLQRFLFITNINPPFKPNYSFIQHFLGNYYVPDTVLKLKDAKITMNGACFPRSLECSMCSEVRCWAEGWERKEANIPTVHNRVEHLLW